MKIDERRVIRWLIGGYVVYQLFNPSARAALERTRGDRGPDDGLRRRTGARLQPNREGFL